MKWHGANSIETVYDVAPYTGAWIEIWTRTNTKHNVMVAPYTGAWIEIFFFRFFF